MRVVSINGCGLRFMGVAPARDPGCRYVTVWATLFFLPLFPVQRWLIRPRRMKGFRFTFDRLAREPLVGREVARTYLYGWLLFPALGLLPMALAAGAAAALQSMARKVPEHSAILNMAMVGVVGSCVVALVVIIWRMAAWNDRRYFAGPPPARVLAEPVPKRG
jgi:predicted membrane-bound spermidine synthase